MSVYVDPLMPTLRNKRWRHRESCHLFADDEAELHEFAARLGLRRAWFQDKPKLKHYDLTKNKRDHAVAIGAVELDREAAVAKWREIRKV